MTQKINELKAKLRTIPPYEAEAFKLLDEIEQLEKAAKGASK